MMDRRSKAVLGYWILTAAWVVSILVTMLLENFAVAGIAMVISGLWQINFRGELAAHYANTRRGVFSGDRRSLRRPSYHLMFGMVHVMLGLVFLLGIVLTGL